MAPVESLNKSFHIAIVGGGIGGLCTAIGLLKQGISISIYESAPAFAEIGAGVSFGPNAVRAMSLIDPEIRLGYEKRSTTNGWDERKTTWFTFRVGMKTPLGTWPDGSEGQEGQEIVRVKALDQGQSSVHRAHFLDELVALIPKEICHFGKRLDKLFQRSDGKMVLEFQDGTRAEADAVIGCDGVKSASRKMLLGIDHPDVHPTFSGKYAYRGLIPMEKAVAALGAELAQNSQMYLGKHGHIITFPIEKGATVNVVAFSVVPDGIWRHDQWVCPSKKEDMWRDFEGWGDAPHKILGLLEKPDVWGLFDHPSAPTFFKGHLCLLGDAAHATTPHQGAGAGQAIEDAYVLTALFRQCSTMADVERAFQAYDAVRRPRSQKVVTTSRRTGRIYEFEDEAMNDDLGRIAKTLTHWYDWIWEEDLELELERAEAIMRGEGIGEPVALNPLGLSIPQPGRSKGPSNQKAGARGEQCGLNGHSLPDTRADGEPSKSNGPAIPEPGLLGELSKLNGHSTLEMGANEEPSPSNGHANPETGANGEQDTLSGHSIPGTRSNGQQGKLNGPLAPETEANGEPGTFNGPAIPDTEANRQRSELNDHFHPEPGENGERGKSNGHSDPDTGASGEQGTVLSSGLSTQRMERDSSLSEERLAKKRKVA